jgi:hypothetical protein
MVFGVGRGISIGIDHDCAYSMVSRLSARFHTVSSKRYAGHSKCRNSDVQGPIVRRLRHRGVYLQLRKSSEGVQGIRMAEHPSVWRTQRGTRLSG